MLKHLSLSLSLVLLIATSSVAQITESEPNDSKATANAAAGIGSGGTITGTTTGTSTTAAGAASADNFLFSTAPLLPGIYRHQMTLTTTGTAGHIGTIRGLIQTASATGGVIGTTDLVVQTSSTVTAPPRMNAWYGFGGASESLYYRVTGTTTTTASYTATLTTTPITPVNLGTHPSGAITIENVGLTTLDTEIWVYDASFTPISGFNNNTPLSGGTQARLTRTFAPGVYYVAIANANVANNLASPADDASQTLAVLDLPGPICNSSTTATGVLDTRITVTCGQVTVLARTQPYEITWGVMTVAGPSNLIAWETNSPGLNININGVQNTILAPAQAGSCVNSLATVNLSSTNIGSGFDVAVGLNPGLAAATVCGSGIGGINSPNGQAVNIDLGDPTLLFLNGGLFLPFPGNFSIPIASPAPLANLSAQGAIFAPSHPDGFELSELTQWQVLAAIAIGTAPGPATDDSSVAINIGCMTFYGRAYTTMNVVSNGRIMFGGTDTDFTPTVAECLADFPSLNMWTDLNPASAGSGPITITDAGPLITVTWAAVHYYLTTTPITYAMTLDRATGACALTGLGGIVANPAAVGGGDAQLLGISPGAIGGATAGVPAPFLPVTSGGPPALATDMIYDFWDGLAATAPMTMNRVGTISAGTTNVTFTPVGLSYIWTAN